MKTYETKARKIRADQVKRGDLLIHPRAVVLGVASIPSIGRARVRLALDRSSGRFDCPRDHYVVVLPAVGIDPRFAPAESGARRTVIVSEDRTEAPRAEYGPSIKLRR